MDISTGNGTRPSRCCCGHSHQQRIRRSCGGEQRQQHARDFSRQWRWHVQAADFIATGHAPSSIAAADFNDDGHIDLAVTNQNDNTVSVFLGNGDGTFRSSHRLMQLEQHPFGFRPAILMATDSSILPSRIIPITLSQFSMASATEHSRRRAVFPAGNGPTSLASLTSTSTAGSTSHRGRERTMRFQFCSIWVVDCSGPILSCRLEPTPVAVATADFDANGKRTPSRLIKVRTLQRSS